VLHAFPAYVSYANEAFGGPANVHEYLSDSSSDWGQQMKSVKRYLDERGIKNCWFAYFGEGVTEYSYYGIPCKPLITADSLYFDAPHDVPPSIDGPVLMSAGVVSGFEFGPGSLNPYEQFKRLKPTDTIDYGVFVYEGHFDIPLASALSHVQKAGLFLQAKKVSAALSEAQQAESLAPESAAVNSMMGAALDANGRPDDARLYYQKALTEAKTVEPAFQVSAVAGLEARLGTTK
jgi:predicted Zn-dependent protease